VSLRSANEPRTPVSISAAKPSYTLISGVAPSEVRVKVPEHDWGGVAQHIMIDRDRRDVWWPEPCG